MMLNRGRMMSPPGMEEEYFWGISLSSSSKEVEWDPFKDEGKEPMLKATHKLLIKQAVLSSAQKEGDVNIIEVEASGYNAARIKIPLAALQAGKESQRYLDLLIPEPPVKFSLKNGEGPVHILGTHYVDFGQSAEDFDELEEEEEEEEDEDMEASLDASASSVAKALNNSNNKRKFGKIGAAGASGTPRSKKAKDDEDDLEGEFASPAIKNKGGTPKNAVGKGKKVQ